LNDGDDPVGGRSLLEASVELRTPIYGPFGGVVFFDVGEVRRQPASYTVGDLKLGAGVGVRYHTIVGPLRVDLGIPFEPPPGEPRWQVHFSIGQAF
jgi:outer membrane translocation and assembly module TamA